MSNDGGISADQATQFPKTPQPYVDEFYAQINLIDEFCIKHNIKMWAIGGSLLGQVRGNAFIPWDDDNDVGVFESDGQFIFDTLRPLLKDLGGKHDLWKSVHGLKLISTQLAHAGTDIFFYRLRPTEPNIVELASEQSRKQWPNDFFLKEELEGNLPRGTFGPITIPIPRNAERQLKSVYGENCLTHSRLSGFNHFTNSARTSVKKDVPLGSA